MDFSGCILSKNCFIRIWNQTQLIWSNGGLVRRTKLKALLALFERNAHIFLQRYYQADSSRNGSNSQLASGMDRADNVGLHQYPSVSTFFTHKRTIEACCRLDRFKAKLRLRCGDGTSEERSKFVEEPFAKSQNSKQDRIGKLS